MTVKLYEVGGSIRNEILGLDASDRDYSVLAPDFDSMKRYLEQRDATMFQVRPQFVAIRAKVPGIPGTADFTLARKESFYTDGRHPDSVTPAQTIEEDLARRDFKMNAIAREVGTDTLIDPYNGQKDIKEKIITSVGDPIERMLEDKLRAFRGIRFSCQLDFNMVPSVRRAIEFLIESDFAAISPERLQVELAKMFKANTAKAIALLADYPDLLAVIRNKGIWMKPTINNENILKPT